MNPWVYDMQYVYKFAQQGIRLKPDFFFFFVLGLSLDMSTQLVEKADRPLFTCGTKDPHDKETILSEKNRGQRKVIIES